MSSHARRGFELAGWLTFVASAAFYLLASLRAGDKASRSAFIARKVVIAAIPSAISIGIWLYKPR